MSESVSAQSRSTPTWLVATVCGIFGLFYAYAVWAGVSTTVITAQSVAPLGVSLSATTWAVLVLTILVPVAAFAVTVLAGRRRGVGALALLLLTGLAVVAVFWMDAQGFLLSALLVAG